MAKNSPLGMSDNEKELGHRKRKKINIRHNSTMGKARGEKRWIKTRRRVRRRILER